MKRQHCLSCGYIISAAFDVEEETDQPRPGDYSICLYCAAMCRFDNDLNLRPLTKLDMEELDTGLLTLLMRSKQEVLKRIEQYRRAKQERSL